MTVLGKSAGTEKHDNADDEQSQHRKEKNIGAFTMHDYYAAACSLFWVVHASRVLAMESHHRELF